MLNMCVSLILDLYVLKCDAEESGANPKSKANLINSIHHLFNSTMPPVDEEQIHLALLKHSFIEFEKLVINLEYDLNDESNTIN